MYAWTGVDGRRIVDDEDTLPEFAPEPPTSVGRSLLEIPVLLAVAALLAITVKTFVAQLFFIPSPSMEPQLTAGDRVAVSAMAYDLHEPRRGDIAVFHDPLAVSSDDAGILPVRVLRDAVEALGVVRPEDTELIKRVIGLPGEVVEGRDGRVFVNDALLVEPYLPDGVFTSDFGPVEIPAGHVWMMGDNRTNSSDSRVFGPVPIDSMVGRAIALVWPPGRASFL